jgi:hypothetical protein
VVEGAPRSGACSAAPSVSGPAAATSPFAPSTSSGENGEDLSRAYRFTPARRAAFLHHLAEEGNVHAACARVRVSKQAAYLARRRDLTFRAGWDAALVHARAYSEEVLANVALHGVREAVFYRGDKVGEKVKIDARLLLAHLARLDARAEDPVACRHAERFDEILALVAGGEPPEGAVEAAEPPRYRTPDPVLPMDREAYVGKAASDAASAARWQALEAMMTAKDPVPKGWEDAMEPETWHAPPEQARLAEIEDEAFRLAEDAAHAAYDAWQDRADACGEALAETGELAEPAEEAAAEEALPAEEEALPPMEFKSLGANRLNPPRPGEVAARGADGGGAPNATSLSELAPCVSRCGAATSFGRGEFPQDTVNMVNFGANPRFAAAAARGSDPFLRQLSADCARSRPRGAGR